MKSSVSSISQLTAWVILAALITGCATPGQITGGIPAVIAAMERTAESRDMVELPEAMRSKIAAFLAPPGGPGIENMDLRYARPYVFDAQAAGEFGYTPLPAFRREARRRGAPIKRSIEWNRAAFGKWAADNQWGAARQQAVLDELEELKSVETARNSAKDFDTLSAAGNRTPTGIWSDGTTMWVADWGDDKIYAYSMAAKARESAKDFDTLKAAGNGAPQGIWSDGTTMWVADWEDEKIYAYNQHISIKHIVQQQINRQRRGYIEAVDRDTGTVTIIWPDLIPPESQP